MSNTRISTFGPRPFGAAKPALAGKPPVSHGSLKSKKGEPPTKNPVAVPTMPGVSSDLLRGKLASMKKTPPPPPPAEAEKSSNKNTISLRNSLKRVNKNDDASDTPTATKQDELAKRRDSMNHVPAGTIPDADKEMNKNTTPEFLRKRLKPTGKILDGSQKTSETKPEISNSQADNESSQKLNSYNGRTDSAKINTGSKSDFRKSLSLFEKAGRSSPPPMVKPKPRGGSLRSGSVDENNVPDKEINAVNTDAETTTTTTENEAVQRTVQPEIIENKEVEMVSEETSVKNSSVGDKSVSEDNKKTDGIPEKGPKPDITVSEPPAGLHEWLTLFVLNNGSLKKLEDEIVKKLPPPVQRDLKHRVQNEVKEVNKTSDSVVEVGDTGEELYDDVEHKESTKQDEGEELYDDVDVDELQKQADGPAVVEGNYFVPFVTCGNFNFIW